jgi:hypothetical protein
MEEGRRAGDASDGNEKKNARREVFRHADQYDQFSVDVLELRAMEGGRRAERASDGDEFEDVRRGTSKHADQYN